jgi:hypothetical protein
VPACDLLKDHLWCSSELIPFHQTAASAELLEWATEWSQSRPACLLYGPTASGKSRALEWLSLTLRLYVIEIDCASASGVREVLSTAEEATKSHSVGLFVSARASGLVVLEHVDSLIPRAGAVPPGLVALLSAARVPTAVTAGGCCLAAAPWLKIVRYQKVPRPFDVLAAALWLRGSARAIDVRERLHGILDAAEGDIRRAALQFQARGSSDGMICRREELFTSLPALVGERQWRPDMYAALCDCMIATDCDSMFWNRYVRPGGRRVFAPQREAAMAARYALVRETRP